MDDIFIGTSGFSYKEWIGGFYPKGIKTADMLTYYMDNFRTVEINSTYYSLPKTPALEKWHAQQHESFRFSFKAFREISNNIDTLPTFLNLLSPFAAKNPKHVILFQFRNSATIHIPFLYKLMQNLRPVFLYACEFRHISWFSETVFTMLQEYNVALVLSDNPKSVSGKYLWPSQDIDTALFTYIRLHGDKELYRSGYTDTHLQKYADIIREKQKRGHCVFCYFNNTMTGKAVSDAQKLIQKSGEPGRH